MAITPDHAQQMHEVGMILLGTLIGTPIVAIALVWLASLGRD